MTDAELMTKIKNGLGITGDFNNSTLQVYIDDAIETMRSAGVKESVIKSNASVGCILQGVNDKFFKKLDDFSAGFYRRATQLSLKIEEGEG